jgi:hypothetical protein
VEVLATALLIVALVLSVIAQIKSGWKSEVVWAAMLIAAVLVVLRLDLLK